MRKILIFLTLLLASTKCFSGDTSDFGWSSTLETNWGAERDALTAHYVYVKSRVDSTDGNANIRSRYGFLAGKDLMWRITGDTSYIASEYAQWVTDTPLCGMAPATVTASASTDTFTRSGGTTKIIMQANSAIQFQGTMPSPLTANTTYYARDINESAGTFKVSLTSGGSAIDLTSAGSGITYTHNDGVYYRPAGCVLESYDDLRAEFPSLIRSYAAIKDNLGATEAANMRDIIDFIASRVMEYSNYSDWSGIPNRRGDTDQSSLHTLSLLAYALVIAPTDATRKSYQMSSSQVYAAVYGSDSVGDIPMGGLTSTAADYSTWRNALRSRIENMCNGGLWVEGSEYSPATAKMIFEMIEHIRDFTGVDYFPEASTTCYETIAKAMINQFAPTLTTLAQWGDMNETYTPRYVNNIGWFGLMAYLGNKYGISSSLVSTLRYMVDLFDTANGTSRYRLSYFDYRTATPRTFQVSGYSANNSDDRGINFYHKNWGGTDNLMMMLHYNIASEHDIEALTTFQGYRSGGWWIDNARGYGDAHQGTAYNTVTVAGGVNFNGAGCDEARGQNAYYTDSTTVYATGSEGGYQALCSQQFPPEESMHEHTRSNIYLTHADGSETLVIHDRIDANDPATLARYANYQGNGGGRKAMIANEGRKHNFHIQVPSTTVTQTGSGSGAVFSWTAANSETVYLKTFMPSYSYQNPTECRYGTTGCVFHGYDSASNQIPIYGSSVTTLKKQIRLVDSDISTQWRTWLNLLHVGSTITTATSFTNPASGDSLDGLYLVIGSEKYAIVFNATQGTEVPPSPLDSNGAVVRDSDKINKLYLKSQFQTSLEIRPPTTSALTLYVANLNPNKQWRMVADGVTTNPISVDSSGLFTTSIPASASNHVIIIDTISTCSSTDWRGCSTQAQCESNNWYWYNNICNQTPDNTTTCSYANYTYCTTQATCEAVGRYWYNSTCNASPQSPTCSYIDYTYCTDQTSCEAVGRYWYNNICNATPQTITCSYADYTYCTTQATCEAVGRFWYNNICNASAQSCSSSSCSTCTTQTTCQAATCYWYNNTCSSTAPPPTGTSTITLTADKDVYIRSGAYASTNFNTSVAGSVSYDTTTSGSATSVSSLSFTHAGSASNNLAVACISTENTATHAPSSVTYGGQAMTQYVSKANNGDDNMLWIYYLTSPPTGSQTFAVTMNTTVSSIVGGVMTFAGASAPEASGTASSTTDGATVTASVTSVTDNDMLMSCSNHHRFGTGVTAQNGQTVRWDKDTGAHRSDGGTLQATTAGTYSLGWQQNFGKTSVAAIAIPPSGTVSANDLEIQDGSGADDDRALLISFTVPSCNVNFINCIPLGSTITAVDLKFNIKQIQSTDKRNNVFKLLRSDWVEDEATWNNYKSGTAWATAGGRGSGDYTGDWTAQTGQIAYHNHQGVNAGDRITYTSNSDFLTYIQNNIGNQIDLIIQQKQNDNDRVVYYSSEYPDSSSVPSLEITFTAPTIGGDTPRKILTGGVIYGLN